jgi:glycosyltransferase involved in cell wall biosynthesis
MRLDLLLPTLRRPELLKRALESLARVERPQRLQVAVIVINNDARPELPGLGAALAAVPFPTRVLHEPRPGKSAALNAAIAASTADYLGFIDDDEEVAPDWFRVVEDALEAAPADFLGGPVLLHPACEFPAWLPAGYCAVVGSADSGSSERPYGPDFPGMLKGGNAVISRATLDRVGLYDPELGPRVDRRLFSCEDEDMYLRLVKAGAYGRYLPNLIVYHCVHADRLRKGYYRAWAFWNGASTGLLDRRHPTPFARIAGVPRYAYGDAVRGLSTWFCATVAGRPAHVRMEAEMPVWSLAGRLYGRHVRGGGSRSPALGRQRQAEGTRRAAATDPRHALV